MGVSVTVLEERAYEDGELVEVALDFFAQHRDGNVYYFGELVDNFEAGTFKDHHGQWIAGEGSNLPGIVMPSQPSVGETFVHERAPGIAEDASEVLSVTETVTTPNGTYTGCLKTRDFTPLRAGDQRVQMALPRHRAGSRGGSAIDARAQDSGTGTSTGAHERAGSDADAARGPRRPEHGHGHGHREYRLRSGTTLAMIALALIATVGIGAAGVRIRRNA